MRQSQVGDLRNRTLAKLLNVLSAIIFVIACCVLYVNEMNATNAHREMSDALSRVKVVGNIYHLKESFNNELVYITGPLTIEEPLTEPEYGVSVPSVLLKRRVQMYQWVEVEDSSDLVDQDEELKTYTYHKEWRDKVIDSNKFQTPAGHQNPNRFSLVSGVSLCETAKIGVYIIGDELKKLFNNFILVTSDERPERRDIKLHAGIYYHSADVWTPEVGDTRVQFSYAGSMGDVVSIIAQQRGKILSEGDVLILEHGSVSPKDMLANKHSKETWAIRFHRFFGWCLLLFCFTLSKSFVDNLRIRHRLIYDFIAMNGTVSGPLALATLSALKVVCCAWFLYNPYIALSIVALALIPLLISTFCNDKRRYRRHYAQL